MALDIQGVKKKLEEERAMLLARSIPPPELARGDEADLAAMEQAKERALWLANDQKQRLAQIDQVLARIAAGKYGICDACGKPIALERMQANPLATMCIEDQAKAEKKRK
ncbi:MAG: TraR/DksA family transcriptional regulator [Chloroflexota bacterium]|nr:TraR/DksA family transcriptional regulator [Chloroflexota bacterium]